MKDAGMSGKRFTAEKIIGMLREAEVTLAQGKLRISERWLCRAVGQPGDKL
jgi:hypothetical protein